MSGLQSYEELEANLAEYRQQLQQVEQLLLVGGDDDVPGQDLQDMYQSLTEVIKLTEDLLADARQQQQRQEASASAAVGTSAGAMQATLKASALAGFTAGLPQTADASKIITPPELNLPSMLPASVAEQIKKAQVRAALLGQAPAAWAIGSECQAVYSADGNYYNGIVEAVTETGLFVVQFEGYAEKEEVPLTGIRPRPDEGEGYRGVAAPKRKRVEEAPVVSEIPKWLEVKETDDEKTRARKKKLLKNLKSKIRFQNMDIAQKQKQDSWQSFMKGKGTKKKTGFLTGTKKQSIFSVGEGINAKVGVVGSGKGMTEYKGRTRHEFQQDDEDD